MAEYIEREAVNKLLHKEVERTWHRVWGSVIWELSHKISQIPDADVVEVVRCKNCKKCVKKGDFMYCEEHSDGWGDNLIYVEEDDFCSYGERRKEDG